LALENGVLAFEKAVLTFEKGVLAFEKFWLLKTEFWHLKLLTVRNNELKDLCSSNEVIHWLLRILKSSEPQI
jgi:hypothetical protein